LSLRFASALEEVSESQKQNKIKSIEINIKIDIFDNQDDAVIAPSTSVSVLPNNSIGLENLF